MKPFLINNPALYLYHPQFTKNSPFGPAIEFKPDGIKILLEYYITKYSFDIKQPELYILKNLNHIKKKLTDNISQLDKKQKEIRVGMIYTYENHSTIIIYVRNLRKSCFFVSDSMGIKSLVSNAKSILKELSGIFPKTPIYYTQTELQKDVCSCHLFALYSLKEILKKNAHGNFFLENFSKKIKKNHVRLMPYLKILNTKKFTEYNNTHPNQTIFSKTPKKWKKKLSLNKHPEKITIAQIREKNIPNIWPTLLPSELYLPSQTYGKITEYLSFCQHTHLDTSLLRNKLSKYQLKDSGHTINDFIRLKGHKMLKVLVIEFFKKQLIKKMQTWSIDDLELINTVVNIFLKLSTPKRKRATPKRLEMFPLEINLLVNQIYLSFLKQKNKVGAIRFKTEKPLFDPDKYFSIIPKEKANSVGHCFKLSSISFKLILKYYIHKYHFEFKSTKRYLISSLDTFNAIFKKNLNSTKQFKNDLRMGFLYQHTKESATPFFYFMTLNAECFFIGDPFGIDDSRSNTTLIYHHLKKHFPQTPIYYLKTAYQSDNISQKFNSIYWLKQLLRKNRFGNYYISDVLNTLQNNMIKHDTSMLEGATIPPKELLICYQNLTLLNQHIQHYNNQEVDTSKIINKIILFRTTEKTKIHNDFSRKQSFFLGNKIIYIYYHQRVQRYCNGLGIHHLEKKKHNKKLDKLHNQEKNSAFTQVLTLTYKFDILYQNILIAHNENHQQNIATTDNALLKNFSKISIK